MESIGNKSCQIQGIFDTREDAVTPPVVPLDELGFDNNSMYNYFKLIISLRMLIQEIPYYTNKKMLY
jgi:hypothetical protein